MPSRATGASFRRAVAFQWFFTAFSVRPGMAAAMSAQRFPSRVCASTSASSSASVHAPRLMSGRTWLFHRSRHCFPVRRPRPRATSLHLRHPCVWTSAVSAASSASVQPCRARSRSLGDVSLKENAFPRGSGETGVTDGARPPGTLVRVAPPLRCANASRSASIASSSMSANDPDPCGRLRMGKGRRSGQRSSVRFLRFPISQISRGRHVSRHGMRGDERKTKRRRRRDRAGTRGAETGVGDAPAQAAVFLRHHVFKAGDVYVGQGEVPALQGRLRNRGDERVSGEQRRFGRFEKNLACAGARARGECTRGNARVPPRRTSSFGSSIMSTASALELRGSNAGRDPPTSMTRAMTRANRG